MAKELTLKQKKAVINYTLVDPGKGILEDDTEGMWPEPEGGDYSVYRTAIADFMNKLRRQALKSLKAEEVAAAEEAAKLLKWKQVDENEYRSGRYRVICEGMRGGCWVPYYKRIELPHGEGLHHISREVAQDACEEHARKAK